MFFKRQMRAGQKPPGQSMSSRKVIKRLVDLRDLRGPVVERNFQVVQSDVEGRRPAAGTSRVKGQRELLDWLPSTITSLNPVISRISLMASEGRVTMSVFPPFFICR